MSSQRFKPGDRVLVLDTAKFYDDPRRGRFATVFEARRVSTTGTWNVIVRFPWTEEPYFFRCHELEHWSAVDRLGRLADG